MSLLFLNCLKVKSWWYLWLYILIKITLKTYYYYVLYIIVYSYFYFYLQRMTTFSASYNYCIYNYNQWEWEITFTLQQSLWVLWSFIKICLCKTKLNICQAAVMVTWIYEHFYVALLLILNKYLMWFGYKINTNWKISKVFTLNFELLQTFGQLLTFWLNLCELIWHCQRIEAKPETAVGFSVNPIWSVPSLLMDYDCYAFRLLKRECRDQCWPSAHLHQRQLTYLGSF